MEKSPSKGRGGTENKEKEKRERNEEALERTQSNTEGDGGTAGQAQFERQVFCCGQHRTHRPAMPPPSLIVNGEYNRPTESAAGFGFRPGRSVSSSHFPPSLRLESAWGSDKRRERGQSLSQPPPRRGFIPFGDSNRFRTKAEEPPRNQTFSICHFALGTPSRPIFSACIADFLCDRGPAEEGTGDAVRFILVQCRDESDEQGAEQNKIRETNLVQG